jgi:type IV secretory pathway TraG/TraD family ATPase VirD4
MRPKNGPYAMTKHASIDGNDPNAAGATTAAGAAVVGLFAFIYALSVFFWLVKTLSAWLSGRGWHGSPPSDPVLLLRTAVEHPTGLPEASRDPALPSGPGWLDDVLTALAMLLFAGLAGIGIWFWLNWRRRRGFRLFRLGYASGHEIRGMLGKAAVLRKAHSVRPSTKGKKGLKPRDVGFFLGRDIRSRQSLFASVEDVFIILAPPRQGKDVHFCTPFTIDAPGACIVTSTRADAFTNTYTMRKQFGDIHVFDPNGLINWPEQLRWSPINGCHEPMAAANRSTSLILGSGLEIVGESALFIASAITVMRCYLHAAALGRRTLRDVVRWTSQPTNPEPIRILRAEENAGRAAEGWASELESLSTRDGRMRGAVWANVAQALTCFSDPAVLEACSPGPDETFDLATFLSGRNTLYILGKEKKNGSIAPVVTALMEDLFDETRRIAGRMLSGRIDPPLTVELNEAAHIAPLPSLPSYMGDSGGFSIALHVYLQSLSQARSRWGEHEAMIMWDNAAVRIIMGGAGNVDDLEDISRLMGEADEVRSTVSSGPGGRRVSESTAPRRVLSSEEIRTLKFGSALVVARAARPVEVRLTPWWKRSDVDQIAAGKAATERRIIEYTRIDSGAANEGGPAAVTEAS